ncbi:MAG: cytochrome C, partial [Actinomycetota bacterium]
MAKYCSTRVVLVFCAAACLLIPPGRLHAQISPGPLSKAHESLSGLTQCTTCHKLGTGGALKCLDCHGEIRQRLALKQGFHAAVVSKESPDKDCVRCHSEHNGENFQLIRWEPSREKFDHAKTGYALEGKHASLQCKQCHNAGFIQPPLRQLIRYKDLNKSFLGLSRSCLSCHKDFHQGQLGRDCQTCHNTNSWKEVTRFDHSRTRYPLTGRHATVACSKCHISPGPGLSPKYRGLNFATCSACHADPHKGAFQKSCDSCHTTAGWKQLSAAGVSSQFDHDKTKFPLRGKHRGLDCAACHRSGNFKQPVPFALCSDCHKPDPHSGQFARRKDGGKCESCHTVEGWIPSTFTIQDHARSAYPLQGAHAKVGCARCHIPAGKATRFKIKFAHCTDCHKDAH